MPSAGRRHEAPARLSRRRGDPAAARVAVSASLTAVIVALAYDEQAKVSRVVRSAIRRARDSGAEARADLFRACSCGRSGGHVEGSFVRSMLHAAGEPVGGLITATDLRSIGEVDLPARIEEQNGVRWVVAPWALEEAPETITEEMGTGHAVCAIDVRGVFAALSYRRVMTGVQHRRARARSTAIAVPVLRGVARRSPGEPLPAPAPIAIRLGDDGTPVEVAAAPSAARLSIATLAQAKLRLRWDATARRPAVVK